MSAGDAPRHPEIGSHARPLVEGDVATDPFEQFAIWWHEAAALSRIVEAAALATCAADGRPSVRMVLVQGHDERGFVFFTNYSSRKSDELTARPEAALLFYWEPLGRQVRIEGATERIAETESDEYFGTRPRGAQLSAWASRQSNIVADRAGLERAAEEVKHRFGGNAVPRPEWWGGYRLTPRVIELWQNRDDRLHDRLRYSRLGQGWLMERLQP